MDNTMGEKHQNKRRKMYTILIKVSPKKIEQKDLSKKTNMQSLELSQIFNGYMRGTAIIEKIEEKNGVFYRIPEEKMLDAIKEVDSLQENKRLTK